MLTRHDTDTCMWLLPANLEGNTCILVDRGVRNIWLLSLLRRTDYALRNMHNQISSNVLLPLKSPVLRRHGLVCSIRAGWGDCEALWDVNFRH